MDDQTLSVPEAVPVTLRVERAARVIGMPLTQAQCADALNRLGFAITEGEGTLTVTPPPHRFDLLIEEDLIEEVARLIGFNNLPTTAPLAPITARVRPEAQRSRFAVRRSVAALGYQETINFSFVEAHWEQDLAGNANPIKLLNPIASQMSVMRSSLLGSLLQVLKFNLDRKAPRVRVFEVGRVFMRDDSVATTDSTVRGVNQPMRVAGLAWGDADESRWDGKPQRVDFYDVKGDVEALLAPPVPSFEVAEHPALHPGRSARVLVDGKAIGFVGELHPRWRQKWDFAQAPVLFELDLDAVTARPCAGGTAGAQAPGRGARPCRGRGRSRHARCTGAGHSRRRQLRRACCATRRCSTSIARSRCATVPWLRRRALAQGEKSMAVRLSFQSDNATLTDEQVEPASPCNRRTTGRQARRAA